MNFLSRIKMEFFNRKELWSRIKIEFLNRIEFLIRMKVEFLSRIKIDGILTRKKSI